MSNDDKPSETGVVSEVMPKGLYRVKTAAGEMVICHLSRHAKMLSVHVLVGQRVRLQRAAANNARGRIVEWVQ